MDQTYEQVYHKSEDQNWWFKAREDFIYRYIKKHFNNEAIILDLGCGGGGLLNFLNKKGLYHTYGIDISSKAVAYCQQRRLNNVIEADAEKQLPYEDKNFDIIIVSDVLEHLHNPQKALAEWQRILKDAGEIIIFVPAYQWLWSEHDEINHHVRRYTKKALFELIEPTGLVSNRHSYWNFFFFLPYTLLLKLKSEKWLHIEHDSMVKQYLTVNKILKLVLKFENSLILLRLKLPFGVSFFASLKKHDYQ